MAYVWTVYHTEQTAKVAVQALAADSFVFMMKSGPSQWIVISK